MKHIIPFNESVDKAQELKDYFKPLIKWDIINLFEKLFTPYEDQGYEGSYHVSIGKFGGKTLYYYNRTNKHGIEQGWGSLHKYNTLDDLKTLYQTDGLYYHFNIRKKIPGSNIIDTIKNYVAKQYPEARISIPMVWDIEIEFKP